MADTTVYTLNIGNTHTSVVRWTRSTPRRVARWESSAPPPAALLRLLCGQAAVPLVLAGVVPAAEARLRKALRARPLLRFRDTLPAGLALRPRPAAKIGDDRIAGVLGARAWAGGRTAALLTVDCGTAITVNACAQNRFLGGAILPGPALALQALHRGTAQLPAVGDALPARAIGASTAQALRSGVLFGAVGAIAELVRRQQQELPGRPALFLTGGAAEARDFRTALGAALRAQGLPGFVYDPWLVHRGLLAAWRAAEARAHA